jgi:lysophospholipase L1-like esterase
MTIRNSISSALFLAAAVAIPWYAGAMAQTMVVVGDSLSAGYLNSSLHQKQQPRGFASVVADQAGIDLPLPLVNAPGLPSLLKLKRGTGEVGRAAGVSNGRVDPTVQAYNLAVPGATAYNAVIDSVETDYPGVATLVDMEDFFDDVSPFILVDGHQFLGTSYLGGIFSLDGIHPTFAAQALIADEFIARINEAYEAGGYVGEFIPPLSRRQIRAALKSDPLVFQLPGNPPPPLGPMFALGEGDTVSGLLGIAAPGS